MGWSWAPYLAQTAPESVSAYVPHLIFSKTDDDEDDDAEDSDIGLDEEPSRCAVAPLGGACPQRGYQFLHHMEKTPKFFLEGIWFLVSVFQ